MPDRKDAVGTIEHRFATFEVEKRAEGEVDDRRLWLAVSSEEPVQRWFGPEILIHEKSAIDLKFFKSGGAPVLADHDHRSQIGVIEDVRLDSDRVLRALVRFGKGNHASEVYDDIQDGIRKNVSIGYRINKIEYDERDGEVTAARVVNWSPLEASMVSVPADTSVGVGRSGETSQTQPEPKERGNPMPNDAPVVDQEAIERQVRANLADQHAQDTATAVEARANEVSEIMQLGARHNMSDKAAEFVKGGKTIGEFRGFVLDNMSDTDRPLVDNSIGMNEREIADFSMFRLIRASQRGASRTDIDAATMELEAVAAAAENQENQRNNGITLPTDVLDQFVTPEMSRAMGMPMQRTLLAGTDTALIPTEHRAQSFIELLRNAAVTMQAGVRTLPGLSGNVDIPRMATSAGATWISAEHGDSTDGEPTFDTVQLSPKDISVSVPMSRRMRQQSSPAIEGLVRMDIVQSMALGIDIAVIEGSGALGQPTGVLNQAGVAKTATWAGVNPTWAESVLLETTVANSNALTGSLAYIGRTNLRGALKTTAKDTGSGLFVMEGNSLNGYPFLATNSITDGNLYFGNWADAMLGMWGGLDLVFDDATLAAKNGLYIRAFQTADVAIRHAESFAYGNDTI